MLTKEEARKWAERLYFDFDMENLAPLLDWLTERGVDVKKVYQDIAEYNTCIKQADKAPNTISYNDPLAKLGVLDRKFWIRRKNNAKSRAKKRMARVIQLTFGKKPKIVHYYKNNYTYTVTTLCGNGAWTMPGRSDRLVKAYRKKTSDDPEKVTCKRCREILAKNKVLEKK